MAQTFKPLYDKMLVRPEAADEKSPGGVHIPEVARERPRQGLVLEIGEGFMLPDGTLRPLVVKPGQIVMFGRYSGTEIKLGGETLLILREGELLGRVVEVEEPADIQSNAA